MRETEQSGWFFLSFSLTDVCDNDTRTSFGGEGKQYASMCLMETQCQAGQRGSVSSCTPATLRIHTQHRSGFRWSPLILGILFFFPSKRTDRNRPVLSLIVTTYSTHAEHYKLIVKQLGFSESDLLLRRVSPEPLSDRLMHWYRLLSPCVEGSFYTDSTERRLRDHLAEHI